MGTGKMRHAGGTVVSTGVQNMRTEGPGTDKAGVLGEDVMVNTVLLAVESPATREARMLLTSSALTCLGCQTWRSWPSSLSPLP
jgi:hypothetical protein